MSADLLTRIQQACPCAGVAVLPAGTTMDFAKAKWPMAAFAVAADGRVCRIDIDPEATAQERQAAAAVVEGAAALAPSKESVDAERDRRIGVGFLFNGALFQSRPEDQKRISGAATLAVIAIMQGTQAGDLRWHGGNSDFTWIAADNSTVTMDAPTVLLFGAVAANWEASHIYAARAIKDQTPVPADFAAAPYWPS
jgi:hypothetical protein